MTFRKHHSEDSSYDATKQSIESLSEEKRLLTDDILNTAKKADIEGNVAKSTSSLQFPFPFPSSSYINPFLTNYTAQFIHNKNSYESSLEKKGGFLSNLMSAGNTFLKNLVCHAEEEAVGESLLRQKVDSQSEKPNQTTQLIEDDEETVSFSGESGDIPTIPRRTKGFYASQNYQVPYPNGSRLATIQRAYDIFTQLDSDHDHCLSKEDLGTALKIFSPNRSFSDEELDDVFNTADTTKFGRIHFSEFYAVFACVSLLENRFNKESFNYITPQEVRSAMKEAGLTISNQQLDHMFSVVNEHSNLSDGNTISFSDMLNIYLSAPRMETDLFLHSWNKLARSDFLHHMQHQDVSPTQDFFAGTCAGIALTLVGHPFDTVKVRMQTSTRFKSAMECVLNTVKNEGPFALYKGMSGPMMTIPLINSLVFLAYGLGKTFLEKLHPDDELVKLSLAEIALAGAFSGFVNCFIVSPVELVKTRLQIQYSKGSQAFRGPMDCIIHILKASGIKGLFRGMAATIYREIPGYAGQFFVYELLKRFLMNINPSNPRQEYELTAFELLISGGIAGMGGWLFSYPMDYVKSQIQAEPWNRPTKFKKNPYLFDGGFFSAWNQTVKSKGFRELWKGFGVCLVRAWPANAAGFLAYETALNYLRARSPSPQVMKQL